MVIRGVVAATIFSCAGLLTWRVLGPQAYFSGHFAKQLPNEFVLLVDESDGSGIVAQVNRMDTHLEFQSVLSEHLRPDTAITGVGICGAWVYLTGINSESNDVVVLYNTATGAVETFADLSAGNRRFAEISSGARSVIERRVLWVEELEDARIFPAW